MQWFKHDTTALTDAKIKRLVIRHGAVGYAVYFHCLELIAGDIKSNNITFELEHDAEIIADNLKIQGTGSEAGVDIVNKIMSTIIELDLFQLSGDKIVCLKLAKRLDSSMTSNKEMRAIIKNSHDTVMIPSCKNRIEEIRIDKNRIDNIIEETPKKEKKHKHGEYKNVLLTETEYNKLVSEWNELETTRMIKLLSEGIELKGYKYKSHYLALRKWKSNEKENRKETDEERVQRVMAEFKARQEAKECNQF